MSSTSVCDPGQAISSLDLSFPIGKLLISGERGSEEILLHEPSQKGLNSCTFYSTDSQLQSPFPTGHAEYMGSKTGRPILQVVTQEEKAQSVEQQVGGRLAQPYTPVN